MRHATSEAACRLAERAARAGMQVVQRAMSEGWGRRRRSTGGVQHKGAADLVTEIDHAAETAVCELLARESPGVPILAEERGGTAASTRWIIDPLDGTTNFVHGFPHFAVSVALEVDGVLLGGCIANPIDGTLASAGRDLGAQLDGTRLHVADTPDLDHALFLTGFGYDRRQRPDFYLDRVRRALVSGQGLRRCGAATHDFLHIAVGRADVYWEFSLAPWDVAAGILLVEEAGGRVTTLTGAPVDLDRPEILATNRRLHDAALELLGH